MEKSISAIIFDFDGVIADSVNVKTVAFGKLFEEYGPDVSRKVVEYHLANGGVSRYDKFRYYYREFLGRELDEAEMARLCDRFAELVIDGVVNAPPITGVGDFLDSAHGRVDCFIVSGTPQDEMRLIVERRGMSGYFREVLGSPTGKGENVADIIEMFGLDAGKTVMFGDSGSDLSAAKSNGIGFVGVLTNPASGLAAGNGYAVAKDFSGISLHCDKDSGCVLKVGE